MLYPELEVLGHVWGEEEQVVGFAAAVYPPSPIVVYREDGATLAVVLRATEMLGGLFDYYGTINTVTFHHAPSATRYTVAALEVGAETPETLSDVFRAERLSADLPLGLYRVEALLVDSAGNRRVVGQVAAQEPGDPVTTLEFSLYERRQRVWFNVRTESRTTVFTTLDRSTVYHVEEG